MSHIIHLARNLGEELKLDDAIQSSGYGNGTLVGGGGLGGRATHHWKEKHFAFVCHDDDDVGILRPAQHFTLANSPIFCANYDRYTKYLLVSVACT